MVPFSHSWTHMQYIIIINGRRPVSWKFKVANSLILSKIRQRLGLDCVKVALSSGAPIHVSTIEFFMGINIPVLDMYGMSESTGPICVATFNTWRLGSVGQCLNGAHLKIDENGEGEVSDRELPFLV